MDIRKHGWFGRLNINGKPSSQITPEGSLMALIGAALKQLQAERSRSGEVTIQLTLCNHPITDGRMNEINRISEIESLLEVTGEGDKPLENESYGEFYDRLTDNGYTPAAAEMIACEWFGMTPSEQTTNWLNDKKAIRFRELNSRDEAFEAALPQEYEILKHYVIQEYPAFVSHLTFRTA